MFRDNQAEGAKVGLPHVVLSFGDVDDLVISGNSQRSAVAAVAAIRVGGCSATSFSTTTTNMWPLGWVQEERGSCS